MTRVSVEPCTSRPGTTPDGRRGGTMRLRVEHSLAHDPSRPHAAPGRLITEIADHAAHTYLRHHPHSSYDRPAIFSDAAHGALRAWLTFDGRGDFSPWAFSKASFAIIDGLRSRTRFRAHDHREHLSLDAPHRLPETDGAGFAPMLYDFHLRDDGELALLAAETVPTLARLLPLLNPQQRDVIIRYYWHEQTCREIATDLGVSEGRVSQVKTQALAIMRMRLWDTDEVAA